MKTFNIDIDSLEGMAATQQVEISGAFTVRENTTPLEGVNRSSLFMSPKDAIKLHGWLDGWIARMEKQPKP